MLGHARNLPEPVRAAPVDVGTRIVHAGAAWGWQALAVCITSAAGLWAFAHPTRLGELRSNTLSQPERIEALVWLLATCAVFVALGLGAAAARRIANGVWRVRETFALASRALLPLAALPFVAALRLPGIERDSPKQTFFHIAAAACVTLLSVYSLPLFGPRREEADDELAERARGRGAKLRALGRLLAPLAVFAAWALYAYALSRLSIAQHHALHTRTTDLGYYDNIFYQSIRGRPLACSFMKAGYHGSAHFDPILVLLSPLYLVHQAPEFLLVLQSIWLGSGVVPIYLLATRELGSRAMAVALALIWALYPALHGVNLYEFHSLALMAPIAMWLLYFHRTGATRRFWVAYAAMLLTREDMPLLLCAVALYILFLGGADGRRRAWTMIGVNLAYFVVVKRFFMISFDLLNEGQEEAYGFGYYYKELTTGMGFPGLFTSLVTNPVFVVKNALTGPKLQFLATLFVPLLFVPFLAKKAWVLLAYGLAFCLLATRQAVYTIHFQYPVFIFPFAFFLVPVALREAEGHHAVRALGIDPRRAVRAAVVAMLVASALTSWKFGGLLPNQAMRGGFQPLARTLTDEEQSRHRWVVQQARSIPLDASVAATQRLGPHVSSRPFAYIYPKREDTKYVFVDELELKPADFARHRRAVQRGELVELARRVDLVLLERVGEPRRRFFLPEPAGEDE